MWVLNLILVEVTFFALGCSLILVWYFSIFLYFILPLAINTKKMLPTCLLVVCSCYLCSLVASRCICDFRGVTYIHYTLLIV